MKDGTATLLLISYYAATVAVFPTLLRFVSNLPGEVIRKMRHICASLSIFILLELFPGWTSACAALLWTVIAIYPVFLWLEQQPKWMALFADRGDSGRDLRKQATLTLLVFVILIAFFWGVIDNRYIIAVAVLTWGFGDAAAAVVGKLRGKTRFRRGLFQKDKTLEGTGAMVGLSVIVAFLTLFFYGDLSWYWSLIIAAVIAPVAAMAELITGKGLDTITVPITVSLVVWAFDIVLTTTT